MEAKEEQLSALAETARWVNSGQYEGQPDGGVQVSRAASTLLVLLLRVQAERGSSHAAC